MSGPNLTLADFPGMANICLAHAMAYWDRGDTAWREGGSEDCICERADDACVRLRGEIAWAEEDAARSMARADQLKAELSGLGGDPK